MPSYTSPLLLLLAITSPAAGFVAVPSRGASGTASCTRAPGRTQMKMAIDYNDPVVMEEFNAIQTMEYDEVVAELSQNGVRAPADMGDMDVKLMLVELRTVMKGGESDTSSPDTPPASYSSKFEEYLWEKPVFKTLYEQLKNDDDHNKMNVAAEYCNDPENARARYYNAYPDLIDGVENALNARPEVTSPTVSFGGFPANMGEAGLRATLEALGEVSDLNARESDDGVTLLGEVTFGSVDVAKAAIEQYDGMDMGMGDKLKMAPV